MSDRTGTVMAIALKQAPLAPQLWGEQDLKVPHNWGI